MLSDLQIRNLKPGYKGDTKTDRWKSDGGRSGLYIRIRATGGKSWVLRRRDGNITLGPFRVDPDGPGLTLREARLEAAKYGSRRLNNITLGELLEEWYRDQVAGKQRRAHEVRGYIDRIEKTLKATKLRELERLEVRQSVVRYAVARGPVASRRLLSKLKTALRFAVDAGYLDASPIDGMSPDLVGASEVTRERVLTDDELRKLWRAESQHTPLLRFLVLTGQRIGETQLAAWSHVHGDHWTIPAAHAKNGREHWVALSRQALTLLRTLDDSRHLVFGRASTTAAQAWLRRWCEREGIVPAFRPHDLRRTFATRLADLGVMPHVIEKTLNHTMVGVMGIYNRSEYAPERVQATQTWADELERLVARG